MSQVKYPVPRGVPGPQLQQPKSRMLGGLEPTVPAGGFVPYPNPRYAMTGGMQPMGGGAN